MAKKKSAERMFHNELSNKIAYGQSKHKDKQELNFGQSTYKIYSYGTYNTYIKEVAQYAKWLETEKAITKIKDIKETEQFAKEYLQHRLNSGVSIYTVKMERSALGMLYNKTIDIKIPMRDNKNIVRSRYVCEYEKHISRIGKYKDIFTIVCACGCRRKDISKLTVNDFIEKEGNLYVKMIQSKGGRDRIAPVVPSLQEDVKAILENAKKEGKNKLFDTIPQKIDVHGLRREYAQSIYTAFSEDRKFRDIYFKVANIPDRREYKAYKDKEVKATFYKDRDNNIYDRNDLYAVSQALGHNRLDVSVTHYLKA
ncbi:MAG: site-specific integrase [Butyrivibrio sp.]|nr:site-specific integrase [Butyrivibrio sp.]